MKIRKTVLGFAAIVLTSLPAAAFAGGPTDAEKRSACTGDVLRLCFSKIGSMDKIESCLRENRPQLSGTCKALFDKYDAVPTQKTESVSPSPAKSEPAPVVGQPASLPQPASAPAATTYTSSPVQTAEPPVPAEPARTASSAETSRTPVVVAPSKTEAKTNETTTSFQPCDMIDCSRLPAPVRKMMRDMPTPMTMMMPSSSCGSPSAAQC
jgi:hypothetical protein